MARYQAMTPGGTQSWFRETHRTYTHAVLGVAGFGDDNPYGWRLCGFCGSRSLAERLARRMTGETWGWERAIIVPAIPTDCPQCAPDEACADHGERVS